MKRLLIFLVMVAVVYGLYANYSVRKKQNDLLAKEVAELQKQNEALSQSPQKNNASESSQDSAKNKRIQDLQTRLAVEVKKLSEFKARKETLTSAANDPGRTSSLNEFAQEIKEKNEAIQSLQLQLSANQDDEKQLDHASEQAKQDTSVTRAQNLAALNAQIRNQQALIQNTTAKIQQLRIQATGDSLDEAGRQAQYLRQEKADLEAMRQTRDQINVATAAQNSAIHQEAGYEKGNIHASEQEIRANIAQLRAEVKQLESENSGAKGSLGQVKQQMNYVDQQISIENDAIARLQGLIQAESQ
jgi:DNA repair exonuclease SbcCD ATPase subunit